MSFLGQVKRRNVFQVAAVYTVVAWLIMQMVDVVGEDGLRRQAVMSVALNMRAAPILLELWEWARPWNEASSEGFVASVDRELAKSGDPGVVISPLRREDSGCD